MHRPRRYCDLPRSVLVLVVSLVLVTRLEVVMVQNVALMAVLAVLVAVYMLRRRSRLNDDV